jgi:uncharacterized phiE125 gp8 family phage protein
MTIARTTDPLVPPVTAQELEDFAVIPASDPSVPGVLLSATSAVFRFLGYDLIAREWVLTLWDWPQFGANTYPNLSRRPNTLGREIALPYGNVLSVESVDIYGDELTNFIRRDRAIILPIGLAREEYKENADPAIVVKYTAGFGATSADVPGEIRQGVLMVAAFLYEHRGHCDALDLVKRSGAAEMLQPWVNPSNLVVM